MAAFALGIRKSYGEDLYDEGVNFILKASLHELDGFRTIFRISSDTRR
jgi:hypothetical protein